MSDDTRSHSGVRTRIGEGTAMSVSPSGVQETGSDTSRFCAFPYEGPSDFSGVFQAATRARAEALAVVDDTAVTNHRVQIVTPAATHSLPVGSIYKDFAEAGGVVAYGPNLPAVYRRAAYYADRILKGAKPSDLPIEQPTHFDLVINMKAAKALGLTIPPSLLLRADRVIE